MTAPTAVDPLLARGLRIGRPDLRGPTTTGRLTAVDDVFARGGPALRDVEVVRGVVVG